MNILLFGGTTEGRELAGKLLSAGHRVGVCVATELGAEELSHLHGLKICAGRLGEEEIAQLLGSGFDLCVDATHPYARKISESVRQAAAEQKIPYRRILRASSKEASGCVQVGSQEEAASYLENTDGNILLTTGSKEISAYHGLDRSRLYVRILPSHESLSACEEAKIPHRNVIAMQGPFSAELNEALLRQYAIRYLVTKDGGAAGGFEEKLLAAGNCGVLVIVIGRPTEEGITMEQLLEELAQTN